MDFHKELQARVMKAGSEIAALAYERQRLCLQSEAIRKRIEDIDKIIFDRETVIAATKQAMRDFDTYLAVKEGAMTLEQLGKAIEDGKNAEPSEEKHGEE